MTNNENYVDPNSGAAPQPGGFGAAPVAAPDVAPAAPAVEQDDEPTDVGADTASLVDQQPAGNDRAGWVEYARRAGAPEGDLMPEDEGGLSLAVLRAQYGA